MLPGEVNSGDAALLLRLPFASPLPITWWGSLFTVKIGRGYGIWRLCRGGWRSNAEQFARCCQWHEYLVMCLWASTWERHGWVHLYPNEGAFPVKQSEAGALEKFNGNRGSGFLVELRFLLRWKKGSKCFKGWYLEMKLVVHLDTWIPFHDVSFQTADATPHSPLPISKLENVLAVFLHLLNRFHSYTTKDDITCLLIKSRDWFKTAQQKNIITSSSDRAGSELHASFCLVLIDQIW